MQDILAKHPLVPVVEMQRLDEAVTIAGALLKKGIKVIEVTLRTEPALQAIREIKQAFPEMTVAAGTVVSTHQVTDALRYGADFLVSPGITSEIVRAARDANVPHLPGVASASEIMQGLALGVKVFKFFPAEALGGVMALKALAAPFKGVAFCPTGGLREDNYKEYLALDCVLGVGGGFLAKDLL